MLRKTTFIATILIFIASFSLSNGATQAAHQAPDISINYDESIEVEANQVVHLPGPEGMTNGPSGENGYGYVIMPEDLPEQTKLTVSKLDDVDFVDDSDGDQITRCGEAYSFTVEAPDGTSYSESFSLALPYCNGLSDLDIYTLDESTDQWTRQNGSHNKTYHDYTVQISDLSKHGVFSTEQIKEEEDKEENGDGNEEKGEDEDKSDDPISISFDEKTEVNADQKVLIKNTDSRITMPSDLPEGTMITVEDVTDAPFVTEADGLNVAGDVFTVTVSTPEDSSFNDSFTLVLSSDEDADDIYYYNEDETEWKKQNGDFNDDESTLTIDTNHFSTYGVFAEAKKSKEEDNGKEPEQDDEQEYVCYEDPADMYIKINFDEKTNVCPEQQIEIENTLNKIVMPKDLPENATLTVTDVGESEIVANAKGFHRAGDVLKFTLNTPEDSTYSENFLLKMPYANGVSVDDIYSYNESTKKWDEQGATFDYEDFTLNVELSQLSTLGVFGITKEDKVVDEEDDSSKTNGTKTDDKKKSEDDDLNMMEVTVEDGMMTLRK